MYFGTRHILFGVEIEVIVGGSIFEGIDAARSLFIIASTQQDDEGASDDDESGVSAVASSESEVMMVSPIRRGGISSQELST